MTQLTQPQPNPTKAAPASNGNGAGVSGPGVSSANVVFTEAPASINFRFDYRGAAGIQMTLRGASGLELLDRLNAAMDRLEFLGATFSSNTRPAPNAAPAGSASASGEAPMCPDGHGAMKPSKKTGGWFCSKVIAESAGKKIYCQHKVG